MPFCRRGEWRGREVTHSGDKGKCRSVSPCDSSLFFGIPPACNSLKLSRKGPARDDVSFSSASDS